MTHRSHVQLAHKVAGYVSMLLVIALAIGAIAVVVMQQMNSSAYAGRNDIVVEQPVCGTWHVLGSSESDIDLSLTEFSAINVLSASDVWLAGTFHTPDGNQQPVVARWNGTRLNATSNPNIVADEVRIDQLTVRAVDDAWAIGSMRNQGRSQILALHWDGVVWHQEPTPSLPPSAEDHTVSTSSTNVSLSDVKENSSKAEINVGAVTAASMNDIWVVGSYMIGATFDLFIMHWDGVKWRISPSPHVAGNTMLVGLAFISKDDIWAFGHSESGDRTEAWEEQPLALHWNGELWEVVDGPGQKGTISGVARDQSGRIWVTGTTSGSLWSAIKDPGHAADDWKIVELPDVKYPALGGLVAVAPDDVWAVGGKWSDYPPDAGPHQTGVRALALHWDGTGWSEVPAPNPSYIQSLVDISAASGGSIWVVGYTADDEDSSRRGLVAHFEKQSCAK